MKKPIIQVGQAPLVSEIVESTSAGRPTVVLDSRSQRPTAKSSVDREKIPKLASESPAVPVRASVGGERLAQDADRLTPQEGCARARQVCSYCAKIATLRTSARKTATGVFPVRSGTRF